MGELRPIGFLLLLPGIALGLEEIRNLRAGHACRSWPTVDGRILSGDVHLGTPITSYDSAADIAYEYQVDGQSYQARRVDYGGRYSGRPGKITKGLLRFTPGSSITVYYDPSDPRRAVLQPGVAFGTYIRLSVAAGLTGIGLLFAAFG